MVPCKWKKIYKSFVLKNEKFDVIIGYGFNFSLLTTKLDGPHLKLFEPIYRKSFFL
jgi:hypothetical protein